MNKKRRVNIFIFFIFLILTVAVYFPGLTPGFHFDDYPNIVDNQLLHVERPTLTNFWQAAWSGASSSFGRPLAYLSFSLNSHFSGLDARMMKITNLAIHLLTGILLFFLSSMILSHLNKTRRLNINAKLISIMACGVWLLHPINLTAVIYVVQRMASLASFFSVCALICYVYFRIRQIGSKGHWLPLITSTITFGLLSFLVKETAVLLLFYISCIEIFIFKFATSHKIDNTILKTCFISTYVISFMSIATFLILNLEWLMAGYDHRNFNLPERLLTESRVLVWYLKMIVAPSVAEMGLFLDDFDLSTSLFQPFTTFLSTAFLLLLICIGFLARIKFTLVAFGIFWFFSGHLLESTFIPLELIFEHRNYLPSFGIIIAVIFISERLLNNKKLRPIITVSTILWISLLAYTTYSRAEQWKDPLTLALAHVEYHPNSVRAHSALGGIYAGFVQSSEGDINEDVFSKSDFHFKQAAKLDTCCSANLVGRLALYSQYDRELPRSEFDELVESLKQKELDPGTHNGLQGLTQCLIDKRCTLSTEDYMAVMYAPLTRVQPDKELSSYDKKLMPGLLVYLSQYYEAVLNDYDTAIRLMMIVVEEQPKEIYYRFTLVNLLVATGQYEKALKELKVIENNDKFRVYAANSKSWKNLIESNLANKNLN